MRRQYTKEFLEPIIKRSTNWGDVAREIGISMHGGFREYIKQRAIKFGIDFSHFLKAGQAWNKGKTVFTRRKKPEEIMIVYPKNSDGAHSYLLRRALVESGMPYMCFSCNNPGRWMEQEMTLQVDHVNGDSLDCRKQNLRFACPNCHSLTDTYKVRNFRRVKA